MLFSTTFLTPLLSLFHTQTPSLLHTLSLPPSHSLSHTHTPSLSLSHTLSGDDTYRSRFPHKNMTRTRDISDPRSLVRSLSVPNPHISNLPQQGLETPGGFSYSQNDASSHSLTEYRTPQSTRCGAKIAGLGTYVLTIRDHALFDRFYSAPHLFLSLHLLSVFSSVAILVCFIYCTPFISIPFFIILTFTSYIFIS